jgi:diketogulonate reductase-like aldo/keto reductase
MEKYGKSVAQICICWMPTEVICATEVSNTRAIKENAKGFDFRWSVDCRFEKQRRLFRRYSYHDILTDQKEGKLLC